MGHAVAVSLAVVGDQNPAFFGREWLLPETV